MNTHATVRLWNTDIGYVGLTEGRQVADFEYDLNFLRSGIELSPLHMPLTSKLYRFPELSMKSFHGLPGLLADSLPDKFGNAIIDTWLATEGRKPESFNAVERLCYIGTRGMGALEFRPELGKQDGLSSTSEMDVAQLVELASEILTHRSSLFTVFAKRKGEQAVREILRVGTSAGGARAKALIAWNPETNRVKSGQVSAGSGFEYWLMKFDGVKNNYDKELADPEGFGVIECAYHKMAKDVGIFMMPCHLFEENGRRHFMTKRFDRTDNGAKRHMQSLAAIAHYDFNLSGAYGYEQAMMVMEELGLGRDAVEQQFRRMVFNIVARNQDDHVKNIAFLMDRKGNWSLSPAFDVTYSFNPTGEWTSAHQMTLNRKKDHFVMDDFESCGKLVRMKQGQAKSIVNEIQAVVRKWRNYADELKVKPNERERIYRTLRLSPFK